MLLLRTCFVLASLLQYASTLQETEDDPNGLDMDDLTTAQLIELRHYKAKNHHIVTKDGYILNLVQANNPLIESRNLLRGVVLFVHGIRTSSKDFIRNSINARPKNYLNVNISQATIEELIELTKNDPSKETLAFTLLNFGYECWFMNRRGSMESRGHLIYTDWERNLLNFNIRQRAFNLITSSKVESLPLKRDLGFLLAAMINYFDLPSIDIGINPNLNSQYWNYSFDEQVHGDMPQVVDYVCNETGQEKLILVGHSAGAGLILMTLAAIPELSKKSE